MADYELTHIRMEQTRYKGKTLVWEVRTNDSEKKERSGMFLGEVKWFGRWRRYSFFPYVDTIYEQKCLREIASFIESRTREHNAELRKRRLKCRTT